MTMTKVVLISALFFITLGSAFTAPTWAAKPIEGEQCFGAIGNKCKGGGGGIADIFTPPAIDLGNGMKRQWVSVGSILHDNCCRRDPEGQHCKGFNPSQELMPDSAFCVKEWRKAFYNSRDGRKWQADYGPYQNISSGDDLTETAARQAALFDRLGNRVGFYQGTETVSTLSLQAPSGTALDIDDIAFCASGKFKPTGNAPFIGEWGICQ